MGCAFGVGDCGWCSVLARGIRGIDSCIATLYIVSVQEGSLVRLLCVLRIIEHQLVFRRFE